MNRHVEELKAGIKAIEGFESISDEQLAAISALFVERFITVETVRLIDEKVREAGLRFDPSTLATKDFVKVSILELELRLSNKISETDGKINETERRLRNWILVTGGIVGTVLTVLELADSFLP